MATISIVVHEEWDLTERIVEGELTVLDVITEMDRYYSGPITRLVMWNLEAAKFNTLNSVDIEYISQVASPRITARKNGKSAVVATSDLGYGFSRMYQAYREMSMVPVPYKSFRVRQEAIDWLLAD